MEARAAKSDVISTIVAVFGHTIIWSIFFLGLTFLGPRAERTIRDFDMKVPELTVGVLEASRWTVEYYYLLPLILFPLLALDAAVYMICRRTLRSRALSILWSAFMFILALAAIGALLLGLILPGARLWESSFKVA